VQKRLIHAIGDVSHYTRIYLQVVSVMKFWQCKYISSSLYALRSFVFTIIIFFLGCNDLVLVLSSLKFVHHVPSLK